MTEIAAEAELSRASLYSMFAGKDELYQEVISATAASVREAVRQQVESLDDPGQQLLCVIDTLFSCYEENENLLRIYAFATHGLPFKIREGMGDSVLEIFVAFTEWVIQIAKRARRAGYLHGLDPEVTTTAARWLETTPDRPLSRAAPPVNAVFQQLLGARGKS
jgi:AcrR family transcriptional regulator